ncbi:zinc ribbon domain-containing protein [Natrinema soli]|uniref:DUF6677 family protein n=1 Tax=Natrinema soli TaxID=1930624 RepID=A0ABD5SP87_9EURY|nr:zinc ribbon domain-containing protein [Natrinema soli]
MGTETSERRPWLALLLGALVTGLGHVYLRRWRRAAGWVLLAVGVAWVFVPPEALQSIQSSTLSALLAVVPLLLVSALSLLNLYVLTRIQQQPTAMQATEEHDDTLTCPNCGKETDPDLQFCQWCTTRFNPPEES